MPQCEPELIPLAHPKHLLPHLFTAPYPQGFGNAESLDSSVEPVLL